MTIKYKYALIDDGSTINIESVLPCDRGKTYTCISCENQLIPVLGEVRERHFRHKVELSCSGETYLHRLAKRKFYDAYTECLAQGKPFLIGLPYSNECEFYLEKLGLSCKDTSTKQTDLTEYFSETPLLESRWGDFIPDILLQTPEGVPLFVEMKVSHGCSQDKINSKHRIIEIEVKSVDSINFDSGLDEEAKFEAFNFKKITEKVDCQGRCVGDESTNSQLRRKLRDVALWTRTSGVISLQDVDYYKTKKKEWEIIAEQRDKWIQRTKEIKKRMANDLGEFNNDQDRAIASQIARQIELDIKIGKEERKATNYPGEWEEIAEEWKESDKEWHEKWKKRIKERKVMAYSYHDPVERLAERPEVYESDYLEDPEDC